MGSLQASSATTTAGESISETEKGQGNEEWSKNGMLLLLTSPFAGTTLQFRGPSHDQTPSKSGSSSSILNIAPPTKLQSSTMTAHLSSFTSTKLTSQLTSKPQIPPMVTPPSMSTNATAAHTSSGLELSTTAVSSVSRYVAPLLLCFFDFGL